MNRTTVLLISRRLEFIAEIQHQLEQDDLRICQAARWQQVQVSIAADLPQLILLDCPEPGAAGVTVCQEIRSRYQGLLLLLNGDSDENLQSLALNLGVDSCFPAAVSSTLVAAQIKALLRRFVPPEPPAVQAFGELIIDANKRDVFVAEQAARLSTIEFNLFWTLVKRAGTVVSREDIHRNLYNSSYNGYDRGIDLCVSCIRQKIGDDPVTPRYLKTVRGAGYQFVPATD